MLQNDMAMVIIDLKLVQKNTDFLL